jgi:hypothetical protein
MTAYVTIVGPGRSIDVEIATSRRVSDLIEQFIEVFRVASGYGVAAASAEWGLGTIQGAPFPRGRTLEDCAVLDGMYLKFQKIGAWNSDPHHELTDIAPSMATEGMGIRFRRDDPLPDR